EEYDGEASSFNMNDFDKITAGGVLELKIRQGNDYQVKVRGDERARNRVIIKKQGRELQLRMKSGNYSGSKIIVDIVLPDLEELNLSGASKATVSDFEGDDLELELSGVARMKIEGKVNDLRASLSGASYLDAFELKSRSSRINASGTGSVKVWTTQELKAETSGASSVRYKGQPRDVSSNQSGASSVRRY
ncbi:MAG: head GIN domain-containing protein, partial [Bacteroidota bacterium]